MIPEREREALMRLTMCAREECIMCKYHKECDFDFQCELATKNMNILADALRKTESNSEKPNNCEDLQDWKDRMWAEAIVTEPTISKMEQVEDEPITQMKTQNSNLTFEKADEPQIYGNEHNCMMTLFGDCSYAETGCGSCEVVEKVRKALDKYAKGRTTNGRCQADTFE